MGRRCAIVGIDVVTALGAGTEVVWDQMRQYACGIRPLRRFPRGRYQTDFAAEIPPELLAQYRSESAGKPSSHAFALALDTARKALKQAFGESLSAVADQTALVLATTKADLPEFERLCADGAEPFPGRFNPYILARDLAKELGLGGPVVSVSKACASGLFAIIHAARLVARGSARAAVAVGVDILSDFVLSGFSSVAALDPQPCRPYDESRQGLSLGEGAGAVVLAPAGAHPGREFAMVQGWGIANDARHITAPAKDANGLILALRRALETAGWSEGDIHYVNGHGTGTKYNDSMEARAIARTFGHPTPPVSSMKGYFGHTLGAAGIIEAVLTVAALRHQTVPASLGLKTPGVEEPINLCNRHLKLEDLANALTIKSGFGGINAVLALSVTTST